MTALQLTKHENPLHSWFELLNFCTLAQEIAGIAGIAGIALSCLHFCGCRSWHGAEPYLASAEVDS